MRSYAVYTVLYSRRWQISSFRCHRLRCKRRESGECGALGVVPQHNNRNNNTGYTYVAEGCVCIRTRDTS
jgi:hypothetical protein